MAYGAVFFAMDLHTRVAGGQYFFEGSAPTLQQCRELAALTARGQNIDSLASSMGLTSIPQQNAKSQRITWVRVLGSNLPAPLAAEIRGWESAGAEVLRTESELDTVRHLLLSTSRAREFINELRSTGFSDWSSNENGTMLACMGKEGYLGIKVIDEKVVQCMYQPFNGKQISLSLSTLYHTLISKYDRDVVNATLAIFSKRQGIPEELFDPDGFCLALEEAGTPANRTQVEEVIKMFNDCSGTSQEKVKALPDALRVA